MPNLTANYSLEKPLDNESADITVINDNMDVLDTKIKEAMDKADSAFQSASNGKTDIATVIGSPVTSSDTFSQIKTKIQTIKDTMVTNLTSKGISALASETMAALADKIANILKGQGNAVESQVLSGATFTNSDGTLRTGNMPNRGAVTIVPSSINQTIPSGYHNGGGVVNAVNVPVANVLQGVTIAGQTGTMPNNGAQSATLDTSTTSKTIPAGYTSGGTVNIVTQEKSVSPSNVVQDVTPDAGKVLSKVTVSAVARHASGSTNGNGTRSITVSGLSFTPSSVIWMYIYSWTKSTNNKVAYKSGSSLMSTSSEFVESITISGTSFTITVPDGYILPTSTAYVWYALEQ